mgnify:CR=1 FL=1
MEDWSGAKQACEDAGFTLHVPTDTTAEDMFVCITVPGLLRFPICFQNFRKNTVTRFYDIFCNIEYGINNFV